MAALSKRREGVTESSHRTVLAWEPGIRSELNQLNVAQSACRGLTREWATEYLTLLDRSDIAF